MEKPSIHLRVQILRDISLYLGNVELHVACLARLQIFICKINRQIPFLNNISGKRMERN
jgi:hypothetical protein